jgi:hypothetical protein
MVFNPTIDLKWRFNYDNGKHYRVESDKGKQVRIEQDGSFSKVLIPSITGKMTFQ